MAKGGTGKFSEELISSEEINEEDSYS